MAHATGKPRKSWAFHLPSGLKTRWPAVYNILHFISGLSGRVGIICTAPQPCTAHRVCPTRSSGRPSTPPANLLQLPRPAAAMAAVRSAILWVALLALGVHTAFAASNVLCQTHIVSSGDSIWSLSAKYGVQQDDLVQALQQCVGYTPGSALQIGQKICLPGYVPSCDYVIESGGVSTCKAYQLQQGDTFASIASTFGIYTQDLLAANADLQGVLQVGTFIRLPSWDSSKCPDPDSDAPTCRVYTVQSGDFPFGIASIFRVTLNDLLAVNPGLLQTTTLQAGQRVRIPPFTADCGNGIVATPPTTGVFSCRAYRVKQGDSLSSLALLFATTVASLVQVNPELADPSLLTPGKIVKIALYPAECLNGILLDPTSTTAATPAGPIPAVPTSPSPAVVMPSPIPSPIPTPIPSPIPSPSPAVVVPSPVAASPAPAPTPAPIPAPTTGIKASLLLQGANATVVNAKAAQIGAAVASLLGLPTTWVTVSATGPSTRRLQGVADSATVAITAATQTPSATEAKLRSAISSGALQQLLTSLGLTLSANSLAVSTYGISSPSPSPSPTLVNSPAPTTPVTPKASSSSGSNVGAIVGGVVGGVAGVAIIAGVTLLIIKKRRAAADAGAAYPVGGVTASVSTGGGLSIKTRAGKLAEDQGHSSSPRNNMTPRTRVGNMA